MRLNLLNIARSTATLGLLALFPGFLLYHYSIAQGWIPPFLGGLFGVVSALLAVAAFVLLPWMARAGFRGALVPASVIAATIVYMALWAASNAAFLNGQPYAGAALVEVVASLATWIAVLFVGSCFAFDSPPARRALVVAGVLTVLALLHAMWRFSSPLGPYLTFSQDDATTGVTSYQGIGRSIVITTIFLAAVSEGLRRRVTLLATGCLLLMLIGSRTDTFTLAALTIAVVGLFTLRGRNLGLSIAAVVVGYLLYYFLAPFFLQTRNAEILDLASSSSWQARHELQTTALNVIRRDPLFGDFGYHHRIGGSGFYAHNALSAWTNYGLLGFLLYVGLILYFTAVSLRRLMRDVSDPAWFAAFLVNAAAVIQAAFAAPVFSPLPALGWGVALNAMRVHAPAAETAPEHAARASGEQGTGVLSPAPLTQ